MRVWAGSNNKGTTEILMGRVDESYNSSWWRKKNEISSTVGASKRQEARSYVEAAQWQAAAQAQGGGGTGYWYIGTCIDAYKFGMRRYNVPCRPHIVRRSTYVGPNGPTDRSVWGGLTDRPTDRLKNWPRSTTLFAALVKPHK